MVYKILVVGGNGFIGSSICKAALAHGMQVASVSSSGKPFQTTKGHRPDWTKHVEWHKGDALEPQSFAHLFPEMEGVVHTIGTLLEDEGDRPGYKKSVRDGDLFGLVSHLLAAAFGGGGTSGNPLAKPAAGGVSKKGSYEALNRDTALRVCEAFMASSPTMNTTREGRPRPFIYISAEDIFKPLIPARYIETKREAEQGISEMVNGRADYRGVYIRPGLVYHAHYRPLTTPAAVLVELSAKLHERIPRGIPTPAGVLRTVGSALGPREGSVFESMANALTVHAVHVDSVGHAVCAAVEGNVRGVVTVRGIRKLIGWDESS
ncbi:hypothetical protein APHAL10511_001129 [Amanita phalloides]|nr:hypothetical protein APHAL10511_001129 [Amanita phalloides]